MRYPCLVIGILFALLIIVGLFTCRLGGFPVSPQPSPGTLDSTGESTRDHP